MRDTGRPPAMGAALSSGQEWISSRCQAQIDEFLCKLARSDLGPIRRVRVSAPALALLFWVGRTQARKLKELPELSVVIAERPTDACPYPRPFVPGFGDCPTFEGRTFLPETTWHTPLSPARTCRHLTVGEARNGEFYARCRLGSLVDRERSAAVVGRARIERLRSLRHGLRDRLNAPTLELFLLRSRLRAARDSKRREEADALAIELRDDAERLLAEIDAFVASQAAGLGEAGLEPGSVRAVFRSAILYFVNRSRSGTFGLPASAVEDMGGDAAALLGFDLIDEG